MAPLARDEDGIVCNVNADDVAAGIAAGLGARQLVLLTDVDGVRDADGRRLDTLTAGEAEALIDAGVIAGGMVPKIRAALAALGWDGAEAIIADASAARRPRPGARRPDVRDPDHRQPLAPGRGGLRRPTMRNGTTAGTASTASGRSASSSPAMPIGSQGELAEQLGRRGYAVTQATVSRDVAELGLVKVPRGDRPRLRRARGPRRPAAAGPTTASAGSSPTSRSRSAGAG